MKKFLTLREAAEYLDVSKSLLYKLTSNRTIRFTRPNNGKIYFNKEDLDLWVQSNEYPTKESVIMSRINIIKTKNYATN